MVKNIRWPKKPKVIFTSNACNSEDVFKAWAASKIESGSKLITAQHGGHYGIGKWYFNEEHEVTISDKFFSWGWSDRKRSKIIPLGQLKQKKPTLVNHNKKKGILLVCLTMPRYSYHMYSAIMSSQYLNYLDDQLSFVGAFPKNLQREIIVRLYKSDYGWEQKERWKKNYPYINNDNGGKIKETYGVPVKEILEGIKHGVRKINIDTDLRLAATAAIRKYFVKNPDQFDPRKYLIESQNAMKDIVMKRLKEFKSAGEASKIKPIPLSVMSKKYSSGELY